MATVRLVNARQLSDSLIYFHRIIHSGVGMAKQGYPGLVLVPPSDRWIIRHRLAYGAFLIIAVAWGASASKIWVPSSDNTANCQTGIEQEASTNFSKGCGQPERSVTETQPRLDEFTVVNASQGRNLAGSHSPVPTPNTGRLATRHNAKQESMTKPSGPTRSSNRAMSPPHGDVAAVSWATRQTPTSPSPDAR